MSGKWLPFVLLTCATFHVALEKGKCNGKGNGRLIGIGKIKNKNSNSNSSIA